LLIYDIITAVSPFSKRGIKGDFIKSTMLDYNQNLKNYSHMLRKDMTKAEIRLWTRLKGIVNHIQKYLEKGVTA
jgi:hypothetical protein